MDYVHIRRPYNFESDDGLTYPPNTFEQDMAQLQDTEQKKQYQQFTNMIMSLLK